MKCTTSRFENREINNAIIRRSRTTIIKYEDKVYIKENIKDHIKNKEYSNILKKNSFKLSQTNPLSKILMTIFILSISTCQLGIYRFISNHLKSIYLENKIFSELIISAWRFQSIFIILIIYFFVISMMKKFFNNSFLMLHEIRSINNILKKENIKSGFYNFISCSLMLLSTNYLTLGFCIIISNIGIVMDIVLITNDKKKNYNLRIFIICSFLSISMILFLDSYYRSSISFVNYVFGICLSLFAFLVKFFFQKPNMKNNMNNMTILELIVGLYLYSFLFSTFFLIIIGLILNSGINSFIIIGWLKDWTLFLIIFISFGILGLLYLLTSTISSIYLDCDMLKLLKYLEIPLNDLYASIFFNLYVLPFSDVGYFVGMLMSIITFFLSDFWNLVFKK